MLAAAMRPRTSFIPRAAAMWPRTSFTLRAAARRPRPSPGRVRTVLAGFGVVAVIAATGAPAANATPIATTGGATSVTRDSATLVGAISVNQIETAWAFQWGTAAAYGRMTSVRAISSGNAVVAVATTIHGLRPGTRYHFRLLVSQGSYPSQWSVGGDVSFTTRGAHQSLSPYGTASVSGRHLTVRAGSVSVSVSCSGERGARCGGIVLLAARGQICGGGTFSVAAGGTYVVQSDLSAPCRALLRVARGHRIRALVGGNFTTHQPSLRAGVTLALG